LYPMDHTGTKIGFFAEYSYLCKGIDNVFAFEVNNSERYG
jgi:hypothetical protein